MIVGAGFTAWAALLAAASINIAAGGNAEFKTFLGWVVGGLLIGLALVFGNWAYSVWTLAYLIDRDTLVIRWGFREVIIPIDTIQRMVPGRTLDEAHDPGAELVGLSRRGRRCEARRLHALLLDAQLAR